MLLSNNLNSGTADLPVELANLFMKEREFVVTPFTNPSGEIVYRLSGWENGQRIRKNFATRAEAEAERSVRGIARLQSMNAKNLSSNGPYAQHAAVPRPCILAVEKHLPAMATTVEKVAADALQLPSDGRAFLVETLLESLSGETDPTVEKAHLAEIRQRREAVRSGKAMLIDGDEALRQARAALRK